MFLDIPGIGGRLAVVFSYVIFLCLMVYKYGEKIRVYNHYTDKRRLLKVKTLCDLFNDMAELHTFEQGVDVATINRKGLTWMLRRIHLFVPDMPRREDRVLFETWNPPCEGLLVPRIYKVSDWNDEANRVYAGGISGQSASTGRLRAFAGTDWMLVNLESRRPERPLETMLPLAGHYKEELPFGPSLFERKEQKGGLDFGEASWKGVLQVQAHYRDIDFNGHVTQSVYIQWMLDAHADSFMENHDLLEMEVVYAHELKPGSRVEVWLREEPAGAESLRTVSYAIRSLDGSILHAWGRAKYRPAGESGAHLANSGNVR